MSNKINLNVVGDIYWAITQNRDNEFLEKLRPGIVRWETNPPEDTFTGRQETIVWISDIGIVDKIPHKLFGLPTTIVLEKLSYRDSEEVVVKINKLSFEDKFEDFLHDKLLVWIRAIFGLE